VTAIKYICTVYQYLVFTMPSDQIGKKDYAMQAKESREFIDSGLIRKTVKKAIY
jgi:hypothetical protein